MALAIPPAAVAFWMRRLTEAGITVEHLVLPPWLEPERARIEQTLLPIRLPVPAPGRA